MEQAETPLMSASDWIRVTAADALRNAVDLKLPTGMVIKARRPESMQLASWGLLPSGLASVVIGDSSARPDAETMLAFMSGVRDLLIYCCLYPRVTLTPQSDDEIHPRQISDKDLMFLLSWAMRKDEAGHLESFRNQRSNDRPSDNGAEIQPAAEPVVGDSGPGVGAEFRPGGGDGAETVAG